MQAQARKFVLLLMGMCEIQALGTMTNLSDYSKVQIVQALAFEDHFRVHHMPWDVRATKLFGKAYLTDQVRGLEK